MEVLQIFNRRTGIWSHRIILTAGYTESFVLDKSTDTAEAKWWEFTDSDIEPPYQDDDWVLMMHVEEKNDPLIFNADGTTKNATQFIIKSISKDYDEGNGLWKMSCALEEPIERFKRIVGETLSFTNQTKKTYDAGGGPVTYYKEPYNYYTALRRWLMVTPANCDSYTEKVTVGAVPKLLQFKNEGLFEAEGFMPSIGFTDLSDVVFDGVYSGIDFIIKCYYVPLGGDSVLLATLNYGESFVYSTGNKTVRSILGSSSDREEMLALYCKILSVENYQRTAANKSWYNRIKIPDEQWLRSIPFADDTWNEMDLYRILFDKYDPLGKTPVIYFDLNPDTTLPYNMARDEYILKFERQDGFDKPVIDFDELIRRKPYERLLSYEVSKDNSTNITGLVCNAENLSSPTVVHYPAQGLFIAPEYNADVRTTTGYTQSGTDGWVLRLPFPIKKINVLKELHIEGRMSNEGFSVVKRVTADITNYALEKKQYLASPTDLTSSSNVVWYEEGEKLIHLKRYYYQTTPSYVARMYYLEYEPLPSARLLIGNEEKTQQINQTSSQVDAESFGRFADGYLKGSNKADITIGKLYAGDYEDFSDLIGSRVKRGDKTYMITQVAYRNIGMDGYNVFMQLNENHMRKNASYSAPQEIRANTAIATSNLKNRLTAIKQVVKVGFSAAAVANNDSYQFLTDKKILLSALCPTQINSKYYPQVALFKGVSTLFTDAGLTNATQFNVTRLATVAKVLSNNQINLITTFVDNAEAGKSKDVDSMPDTGFIMVIPSVKKQTPELYTDPFGETNETELYLSSISDSALPNIDTSGQGGAAEQELYKTSRTYNIMGALPVVSTETQNELIADTSLAVRKMMLLKDSMELCNINLVAEIQGKDCIICQDAIRLSRLVNQNDNHTLKIWVKNEEISNHDTFTDGIAIAVLSTVITAEYIEYTLAEAVTITEGKAVVISTQNNEPLVIYNNIDTISASLLEDKKLRVYFN